MSMLVVALFAHQSCLPSGADPPSTIAPALL
jgi:hypothetical protein